MNYVAVIGVFQMCDKGHPDGLVGGITGIKSCDAWSQAGNPLRHKIKNMLKPGAKP
jgi:hypothetical protein